MAKTLPDRPQVRIETIDGYTHIFLNGIDVSGMVTDYTLSESACGGAALTLTIPVIGRESRDLIKWAGSLDRVVVVADESYAED